MTTTTVQRPSTPALLIFIATYRTIESATYQFAKTNMIDIIARSVSEGNARVFAAQQAHLTDQWKSKRKGFGQFFLNISWKSKITLLQKWGVLEPGDEDVKAYLKNVASHQHYQFLNRPTGQVLQLHNMILFFENHGMNIPVMPGIELTTLPAKIEDRYGNSANWGKHIMNMTDKERFFDDLFTHFNG